MKKILFIIILSFIVAEPFIDNISLFKGDNGSIEILIKENGNCELEKNKVDCKSGDGTNFLIENITGILIYTSDKQHNYHLGVFIKTNNFEGFPDYIINRYTGVIKVSGFIDGLSNVFFNQNYEFKFVKEFKTSVIGKVKYFAKYESKKFRKFK
jgi:hypothetical protein